MSIRLETVSGVAACWTEPCPRGPHTRDPCTLPMPDLEQHRGPARWAAHRPPAGELVLSEPSVASKAGSCVCASRTDIDDINCGVICMGVSCVVVWDVSAYAAHTAGLYMCTCLVDGNIDKLSGRGMNPLDVNYDRCM